MANLSGSARQFASYPANERRARSTSVHHWSVQRRFLAVVTAGFTAVGSLAHAAERLRRSALWRWTAAYGVIGLPAHRAYPACRTGQVSGGVSARGGSVDNLDELCVLADLARLNLERLRDRRVLLPT